MTPMPKLTCVPYGEVQPGKFVYYAGLNTVQLGFTIKSLSGTEAVDLILFPHSDLAPDDRFKIYPLGSMTEESVLTVDSAQVRLNPISSQIDLRMNKYFVLGNMYVVGNKLAIGAVGAERQTRPIVKLFSLEDGSRIETQGQGFAAASFDKWEVIVDATSSSSVLLYNPLSHP